MKLSLKLSVIVLMIIALTTTVIAQTELPNPGITPDSPFYFLDKMMDVFRSSESITNRRAAEIIAMALEGNEDALKKAEEGYNKSITRRLRQAERNEEIAEKLVQQMSNHMVNFAEVSEKIPLETKANIKNILNDVIINRENGLRVLGEHNRDRSRVVAQETLNNLLETAPEQALPGLIIALEAHLAKSPEMMNQIQEQINRKGIDQNKIVEARIQDQVMKNEENNKPVEIPDEVKQKRQEIINKVEAGDLDLDEIAKIRTELEETIE
jgi:hypothetical protein